MVSKNWQDLNERLVKARQNFIRFRQSHIDREDRPQPDCFELRRAYYDCMRMYTTTYQLLAEADREWVTCRRRGKVTHRFNELMSQAEECLKNFEKYVLLAHLLTPE